MKATSTKIACSLMFIALFSKNASATSYSIVDLGVLPGYSNSYAYKINQNGDVVGSMYAVDNNGAGLPSEAFIYKKGSITDIGPGTAMGINAQDQVIISQQNYGKNSYMWQNGLRSELPAAITPKSINDNSDIVGTSNNATAVLLRNGKITNLSVNNSDATSINNAGYIGGWIENRTVIWGKNGEIIYDYNNQNGVFGGQNINEHNTMVGIGSGNKYYSTAAPYIYSSAITNPLPLPGSITHSDYGWASSINNSGTIVGSTGNFFGNNDFTALLWENGQAYILDSLPGIVGSGWHLSSANDINDSGQIVGAGYLNGHQRAFLMTPISAVPEPETWLYVTFGIITIAYKRNRSRIINNG